MKRLYAVFAAAAALSLMLSGCGQTVNKNASSLNDLVGDGMSEEQQVQEQLNNFAKDADEILALIPQWHVASESDVADLIKE